MSDVGIDTDESNRQKGSQSAEPNSGQVAEDEDQRPSARASSAPDAAADLLGRRRRFGMPDRRGQLAVDPAAPKGIVDPPEPTTFDDLIDAHYGRLGAVDNHAFREAYEKRYGEIEREYFGQKQESAIVLTNFKEGQPSLRYRRPPELGVAFANAVFKADHIIIGAERTLVGRRLLRCFEIVYSALEYLFRLVDKSDPADFRTGDAGKPTTRVASDAFRAVMKQLDAAEEYYEGSSARRAILLYMAGILAGILAIVLTAVILFIFGLTLRKIPVPSVNPVLVYTALGAGCAGAIFSVMIRITQGKLHPLTDVSKTHVVMTGAFRPLIGLVSGGLIYFIVQTGLIPLAVPTSPTATWNFFVAVAFVAGFSERLIQDAIVTTERRVSAADVKQTRGTGSPGN